MASKANDTKRLREALIGLCVERSLRAIELDELLARAGVGRYAFEARFADLEGFLGHVLAEETRRYLREAAPPRDPLTPWRERLRATLYALYRFVATDRRLAHLFLVDWRVAGERTRLLADQALEALFDLIDEGRGELAEPDRLSRATAEAIGGGIFNQLYVLVGRGGPLPDERRIVPHLLYCAVLPYLGAERAAEELRAPPPPPQRGSRRPGRAVRLGPRGGETNRERQHRR